MATIAKKSHKKGDSNLGMDQREDLHEGIKVKFIKS